MKNFKEYAFLSFSFFTIAAQASPAAVIAKISDKCKGRKDGYACFACEEGLQNKFNALVGDQLQGGIKPSADWAGLQPNTNPAQLKPGATLEGFLASTKKLMTDEAGGFNFVMVGNSASAQETSVNNPRILMKSANSELYVSFGTDPTKPGFNKAEIMRWNGKAGKYEFQELIFPMPAGTALPKVSGDDPHGGDNSIKHGAFDGTGETCARCHGKEDARPKWDTYRAWGGVLPPTGDLRSDDPASQAFLDAIADGARSRKLTDENYRSMTPAAVARAKRMALLDIPTVSGVPGGTDEAKIKYLRENGGTIQHWSSGKPSGSKLNTAGASADSDPPPVVMFDQMSDQQTCQIARSLKDNPNWKKYKYALLGLLNCEESNSADMARIKEYLPQNEINTREAYFADKLKGPGTGIEKVVKDIDADHRSLNGHKKERHIAYLKAYSASKGTPMTEAELQSNSNLNGVGERSTEELAAARYIMEPMGVKPATWSMSVGKNIASVGYTFADYFPIVKYWLSDEWDAMKAANGGSEQKTCEAAHKLSQQAFAGKLEGTAASLMAAAPLTEAKALEDLAKACTSGGLKLTSMTLDTSGQSAMKTCIACHTTNEDARNAFSFAIPAGTTMNAWLNGKVDGDTRAATMLKAVRENEMPPGDFDEGKWKSTLGASTSSTAHGNAFAKRVLSNYISRTADGSNTNVPIDCDYFQNLGGKAPARKH